MYIGNRWIQVQLRETSADHWDVFIPYREAPEQSDRPVRGKSGEGWIHVGTVEASDLGYLWSSRMVWVSGLVRSGHGTSDDFLEAVRNVIKGAIAPLTEKRAEDFRNKVYDILSKHVSEIAEALYYANPGGKIWIVGTLPGSDEIQIEGPTDSAAIPDPERFHSNEWVTYISVPDLEERRFGGIGYGASKKATVTVLKRYVRENLDDMARRAYYPAYSK